MKAESTDIFISYRRIDGRDFARNILLALGKRGYENVFFDYSSMREGAFNQQIFTAIEHCKDFLLILSPLSMLNCSRQEDWVAIEIEKAISCGCNIIPISINEPFNNWPEDFPRKLSILKRQQMLTLRTDEYFDNSIDKLTEWLESEPTEHNRIQEDYSISIISDETCELYINNERIRKIKANKAALIKGINKEDIYIFSFRSLARVGDIIDIEYHFSKTTLTNDQLVVSFIARRLDKIKLERKAREARDKAKKDAYEKHGILKSALESYDEYGLDSNGMVAVVRNKKIGFVNRDAIESVPCIYDDVMRYEYGYASVCRENQWGLIDEFGNEIAPIGSQQPCVICPGGHYFTVTYNEKIGISTIPICNNKCFQFEYDEVVFLAEHNDFILGKKDGIWCLVSGDNTTHFFPNRVSSISARWEQSPMETFLDNYPYDIHYHQGYNKIRVLYPPLCIKNFDTGRLGIINNSLKMSVPFSAEKTYWVGNNQSLAIVMTGGKYGLIDYETGRTVLPTIYSIVKPLCKPCYLQEEYDPLLFLVGDDISKNECNVDNKGNIYFDTIDGYYFGGNQGVTDEYGNLIIPQVYQLIDIFDTEIKGTSVVVATKYSNYSAYFDIKEDHHHCKTASLHPMFDESNSIVHIYSTNGVFLTSEPYTSFIANHKSIINRIVRNIASNVF